MRVRCVKTVERRNFLWKGKEKCIFIRRGCGGRKNLAGCARWIADEGGCPYVVLEAECRASIAAFTLDETASVSCTVNPAVEIGSPTRISSGWHLMW